MPERSEVLVTNTTPLISLAAAMGNLDVLRFLYRRVVVPYEVAQEVRAGGLHAFGVDAFQGADRLDWRFAESQAFGLRHFYARCHRKNAPPRHLAQRARRSVRANPLIGPAP